MVWKVSVLYSQPPWQLPAGCPLPGAPTPLWLLGAEQDTSGWPSVARPRVKFKDAGAPAEGHVERHKCGGTAPVKMDTSMWNARKIWGRQIHTYKIHWNLPKPPIRRRISSKFISLAFCRRTTGMCKSEPEGPQSFPPPQCLSWECKTNECQAVTEQVEKPPGLDTPECCFSPRVALCLSAVDYKAEGDLTSMGWECTECGGRCFLSVGGASARRWLSNCFCPYPRLLMLEKFYNVRFISGNPAVTELSECVQWPLTPLAFRRTKTCQKQTRTQTGAQWNADREE